MSEKKGHKGSPKRPETLIGAVVADDLDRLRELIAQGADVDEVDDDQTALAKAAELGRLEMVEALLEAGADGNFGGFCVPLVAAAYAGHVKVVRRLLDAGADVDRDEEEGITALMSAAKAGHLEVAKMLIKAGADPALTDSDGESALTKAHAHPDVVKLLQPRSSPKKTQAKSAEPAAGPQKPAARTDVEAGELPAAAGEGDLETVRRLIEAGASPDAVDDQGRTPLFMAVSRGRPEVVAFLLKAKADPNKPIGGDNKADTQWGGVLAPCPKCGHLFVSMIQPRNCPQCRETFDTRSTLRGRRPSLPLYVAFHNNFTPLMAAAKLGDANIARMLIEHKAKINAGNGQITPLMCASHLGHLDVAKLLIEKGADVQKVAKEPGGSDKVSAIQIASNAGYIGIVKLLWEAGVPGTQKEQTLLVDACRRGDVKTIRSLLAEGADANQPDPLTEHWPLQAAAESGNAQVVDILIQAGAVASLPASKQLPPLFVIADKFQQGGVPAGDEERYLETVKKLIDAGARATVNFFGITPLSMAEDSGYQPLIDLLQPAAEREKAAKKPKR